MAYENLCLYCFEDNGGNDVCPHCGRDAREAVPQIQLLPGTMVYRERFLVGRALGQDASGIVYAALDTKRGVKIRIREYLPRDCARRLNSGEVVPEAGMEDQFDAGMRKLRASVEGVEDPAKRHFFFEENGTGYIAQRKNAGGVAEDGGADEEDDHRGARMALVIGIAAVLVIGVAVGVIALVNYFTNKTDSTVTAPAPTGMDLWEPPVSPTPTPYAAATFGAITDPTHSWMDFTNPDLKGDDSDYATPSPAPTPKGGMDTSTTINANSSKETITKLQQLLANLGWMPQGNVNGKYDNATKQAVKDFQQYMNDTYALNPKLTVDGVAGPKTLQWLLKTDVAFKPTPTPKPVTPSPTQKNQVVDENASMAAIKYVQSQLNKLGALSADQITGKYDAVTRGAVKQFQIRVNDLMGYDCLSENGTCDDRTLAYLDYYVDWWEHNQPTEGPSVTPTPNPGQIIDEHSPAQSVKAVQQMLIDLGYLKGKADGSYGKNTYAAVTAFQKFINEKHGNVARTDGKCDELTLQYLEYYHAQPTDQPTAEPTPQPGVDAPTITVEGAQSYNGGVYTVGEKGVKIKWNAAGAKAYSIYLTAADGTVISKEEGTAYQEMTLQASSLPKGEESVFTVKALATSGSDAASAPSAYVKLTAEAATPEETPGAVSDPAITVTGATGYVDGVYHVGADGAVITWTADGAASYGYSLTASDGTVILAQEDTQETSIELSTAGVEAGATFSFTVTALPESGAAADGRSSTVRLLVESASTEPPAVTPSPDFEAPVLSVSGAVGEDGGVYWVGEIPVTVSWSAEGNVRAYSYYLVNSAGTALISQKETGDTSLSVPLTSMTEGEVYTVAVVAIPEGGAEEDGKYASVGLQLYVGQTPEPTPASIGDVNLMVDGYKAAEGGVYYGDNDAVTLSWSADGAVTGYDLLLSSSDGSGDASQKAVSSTSITLDPHDWTKGVTYTFTVTAIPENGTAEDGKSASVTLARYEAPAAGAPVITVSGHAGVTDEGVYLVGENGVTVSWTAQNAAACNVAVLCDGKTVQSAERVTENSVTLPASGLDRGALYLFSVTALSEDGDEGKSASAEVLLMRAEPAEVSTPVFTVSGEAGNEDGTYLVGESAMTVSWTAENAARYNVSLTGGYQAEGVTETTQTIDPSKLQLGTTYVLSVTAIPEGGDASDGKAAEFAFRLKEPEPVVLGDVSISVEGYASYEDDVYYAKDEPLTISWTAENAAGYNVIVLAPDGSEAARMDNTQNTSTTLAAANLEGGVFAFKVEALDSDGKKTEPARVNLSRLAPEPTPEPVVLGAVSLTVSGYDSIEDDVYCAKDADLSVSWSAENAVAYNVALFDASGNTVQGVEGTAQTSVTVALSTLESGVYTFAAQAVGEAGETSETAKVRLTRLESEPTPSPEPLLPGKPGISVSGYDSVDGDVYVAESGTLSIEWSAENAVSYNVGVYLADGTTVNEIAQTAQTSASFEPDQLRGNVVTLKVQGVGEDGTAGATASVSFTAKQSATPEPEPEPTPASPAKKITPSSSYDDILAMQMRLYELGWLSKDGVTPGTFDAATMQAVSDYQNYIITNGWNPELSALDPSSPVVDEVTLTMLADQANPIYKPQ